MQRNFTLPALALILAVGPSLAAQVTTGSLSGRVLGEGGRPLKNARISLESPALFEAKVLRTDAGGVYRAQLLPVGNYSIRVSAEGYLGKTAKGVRVGLGTNLSFDFTLQLVKEAGAVVEVVAKSVQESKSDDKVATNFSAEELVKLPTDRSFGGAAQLSPGVSGGGGSAYNIRGGSTAGQSTRGGGYEQVNFTVDGIDVKDDTAGVSGRHVLFDPLPDSIEDVQVVQSQMNARFGRTTGGALNIATKSGSNTFEGTLRAFINRPSWTTNLPHGSTGGAAASEAGLGEGYSHYTDLTLGGPIIKDRLWFFLGARFQPAAAGTSRLGWGTPGVMQQSLDHGSTWQNLPGDWRQYMKYPEVTWGLYPNVDNVLRGGVDTSGNAVPGVAAYPSGFGSPDLTKSDNGAIIPTSSRFTHLQGKISAMVNSNNTLNVTYLYGKTVDSGQKGEFDSNLSEVIYKAFVGDRVADTKAYTLNWNSTLKNNWFLEAKASKADVTTHDVSGPTTYPVFLFSLLSSGDAYKRIYTPDDPQSQAGSGSRAAYFGPFANLRMSSSYTPNIVANITYTVNVKTIQEHAGTHEVDFGADYFETQSQFGRERNRNYGVMEGGFVQDPTKSPLDASAYAFPVFYTSDGSSLVPSGAYGPDDNLTLYQQVLYGPSAHVEQYNVFGAKSRNTSTAVWLNDTWTINDRWNLMVGIRHNRFIVKDTNGKSQCDNNITEPRFQVKYNPDGRNSEVFAFTAAKLASRYSDDFASFFRTNGWTSRNVRAWSGTGYNQRHPGDAQPAIDTLNGTDGGRYGVRWVSYDELTNLDNYNTMPEYVVALDQTMRTDGLQVPYVLEFTLGYTRNYDNGSFRVNLVNRTFRKDWVAGTHQGMYDPADPYKYLTLVKNPVNGQPFSWNQTQLFINSDQRRDYQSVELSWKDKLTSKLSFGGSFTYSVEHGISSELDYYNFRDEKLKLPTDTSSWGPKDALLSRQHMLNVYFTYEVPVGKGNVSASILGKLYSNGQRSLAGGSAMWEATNPNARLPYTAADGTVSNLPVFALDSAVSNNYSASPQYTTYYGSLNQFSSAYGDNLDISMKLQGQLPLGRWLMLVAEVQIENPFNRITRNHIYDWGSDTGTDWTGASTPIVGRALGLFNNHAWGYSGDSSYYDRGRTWSFNVGLKF